MSNHTILLADDNAPLREAFAQQLQTDYDVRDVGTGEDLLDALDPGVDAVVCDWRLTGLQQTELLDAINKVASDTAVVVISGRLPPRNLDALGVDESREKPIQIDTLRDAIHSAIETQPSVSSVRAQQSAR